MRKISSNRISGLRGRRVSGNGLDPYMDAHKKEGVSVCTTCRAVHERGKWRWTDAPKDSQPMVCPACRRVEDHCPAHLLRIDGVPQEQQHELVAMIHHAADEEARLHPIERLMWLREDKERIEVALTGAHIARRLRAAIARSWRGSFASKLGVEHTELRWKPESKRGGKHAEPTDS